MAKVLKEFPKTERCGGYPWDEWLDGKVRLLAHEDDFHCSVKSMRMQAYKAAKERKVTIATTIQEGDLILKANKR
jgi:hypothetical protein